MSASVPQLTDHLGYWLRQVSNHVSHGFARKLAAQDVTVAEWGVMRVLYGHKGVSPSQLADEMGLTRGAVTKLADRLIAKELLTREANTRDKRTQTLRLTARAARFVPKLAALADENEAEFFAHLPATDRRHLRRILEACVKQLGVTVIPID